MREVIALLLPEDIAGHETHRVAALDSVSQG